MPDQSAIDVIKQMLAEFGLSSLAPKIADLVRDGYTASTIQYQLQQTAEWKRRFAANEARVKAGLPVLSPQEYIATERAYRAVMAEAGLPAGFYDRQSDFQKFLEGDVSPSEVQDRVKAAQDLVSQQDPSVLQPFLAHYGMGDVVAGALDTTRATAVVKRNIAALQTLGEAGRAGVGISTAEADRLAAVGVTRDQAAAGFTQIAGQQSDLARLADVSGEDRISTGDLVSEAFTGDASVTARKRVLQSRERARFGGSSGASSTSLTRTSTAR